MVEKEKSHKVAIIILCVVSVIIIAASVVAVVLNILSQNSNDGGEDTVQELSERYQEMIDKENDSNKKAALLIERATKIDEKAKDDGVNLSTEDCGKMRDDIAEANMLIGIENVNKIIGDSLSPCVMNIPLVIVEDDETEGGPVD